MAPRPPDPDEPLGGEPPDEEQGTTPDDADVQRQWDEIVARLSEPDVPDPRAWAPDPVLAEQEEHFTPPDPGPVLGGDPLVTMAWVAAAGVPVLLLVAYVLLGDLAPWLVQTAGATWLAGLGVLVWRMPRDRSGDDGPGAVV